MFERMIRPPLFGALFLCFSPSSQMIFQKLARPIVLAATPREFSPPVGPSGSRALTHIQKTKILSHTLSSHPMLVINGRLICAASIVDAFLISVHSSVSFSKYCYRRLLQEN
ncbi:hypothetical protein V2G26_000510 [Clonostachys chloroleuca]